MHRYALAVIVLLLFATPAWGSNTLTWKDNSTDEAFFVIEKRAPNGQYHDRLYDFVGPNSQSYIDTRTDDNRSCYRISAVTPNGVRSKAAEFCVGQIPNVGNVTGVACNIK